MASFRTEMSAANSGIVKRCMIILLYHTLLKCDDDTISFYLI